MVERCLFLPDNVMALLYEEQKLIQSLLDFPFRTTIPLFKLEKEFSSVAVLPPLQKNGFIIRPCVDFISCADIAEKNMNDTGFVLGNAGNYADTVLAKIANLKQQTKLPVFTKQECRSWYYADVEIKHVESSQLYSCLIRNKIWKKQINDRKFKT